MNVRDGPMEDSEPNRWKTLITNVLVSQAHLEIVCQHLSKKGYSSASHPASRFGVCSEGLSGHRSIHSHILLTAQSSYRSFLALLL